MNTIAKLATICLFVAIMLRMLILGLLSVSALAVVLPIVAYRDLRKPN